MIEVIAVVAILAVVAIIAAIRVSGFGDKARLTAAESDLRAIRDSIMDPQRGYLSDMRGIPGFSLGYLRLANLFISTNLYGEVWTPSGPVAKRLADSEAFTKWSEERERGWRGPYLNAATGGFPADEGKGFYPDVRNLRLPSDITSGLDGCSVYGFPGEPSIIDPWGNPYVLQIPPPQAFAGKLVEGTTNATFRFGYARVVSAGPDGKLETPCFGANFTNMYETSWTKESRKLSRQAGRLAGGVYRGDDLVLFLERNDIDEGDDE